MDFLLGWGIFRCYISFRVCISHQKVFAETSRVWMAKNNRRNVGNFGREYRNWRPTWANKKLGYISHRIHGTCIFSYMHHKNQPNVGKCTIYIYTWIFRPCLFSGPGPKSRFFKPWKWFQTLISKSDPAYSLNNGKLLKHTTPPRSFPPSGSLASRLKRLISLKFAEWKLHKNIMSLVWSKNNCSCI